MEVYTNIRIRALVGLLLVAALLASAGAGGWLRTVHGLALAGASRIEICGGHGPEMVTVDRDGRRVDPAQAQCGHCPDCMQIPLAQAPAVAETSARAWVALRLQPPAAAIRGTGVRIAPVARGPPSRKPEVTA